MIPYISKCFPEFSAKNLQQQTSYLCDHRLSWRFTLLNYSTVCGTLIKCSCWFILKFAIFLNPVPTAFTDPLHSVCWPGGGINCSAPDRWPQHLIRSLRSGLLLWKWVRGGSPLDYRWPPVALTTLVARVYSFSCCKHINPSSSYKHSKSWRTPTVGFRFKWTLTQEAFLNFSLGSSHPYLTDVSSSFIAHALFWTRAALLFRVYTKHHWAPPASWPASWSWRMSRRHLGNSRRPDKQAARSFQQETDHLQAVSAGGVASASCLQKVCDVRSAHTVTGNHHRLEEESV